MRGGALVDEVDIFGNYPGNPEYKVRTSKPSAFYVGKTFGNPQNIKVSRIEDEKNGKAIVTFFSNTYPTNTPVPVETSDITKYDVGKPFNGDLNTIIYDTDKRYKIVKVLKYNTSNLYEINPELFE